LSCVCGRERLKSLYEYAMSAAIQSCVSFVSILRVRGRCLSGHFHECSDRACLTARSQGSAVRKAGSIVSPAQGEFRLSKRFHRPETSEVA
jgi:hypothetical protein